MKIEKINMEVEENGQKKNIPLVSVDKEKFDYIEITEAHVGKTLKVARKPSYYTESDFKMIQNFRL